MTDALFVVALVAYLAILLALFAYGMNFVYLSVIALRTGDRRPPTVEPDEWPLVTIQLPIYNEFYVARRLLAAAAALDYPADRLEIQVLDDSDDETAAIVAELVVGWQAQGVNMLHVRRGSRTGYKAGALGSGLEASTSEFVAIFDADFIPSPDFLRATVPTLVADPGLAFVQARWGHVNRDSSLLTRLQALAIDGHFAIEQAGRWAKGYWFNFNGTAGVWRRAALVEAGGWQADTLTEDLDISYRAHLAGWRAAYVGHVEAPAELPVSFNGFRRQQHRWARGSFECAAKHLPAVWRSGTPFSQKLSATLHLTGYGIHLLLLGLSVLYPLILLLAPPNPGVFVPLGMLGLLNITSLAPTVMFTVGQHRLGRSWFRQIPSILLLTVFGSGMMVNSGRAAWQAWQGGPAAFERTAKFGVQDRSSEWLRSRYQLAVDPIVGVELAMALLNAVTCVVALSNGFWAVAAYAGIFGTGLSFVAIATLRQGVQIHLAGLASELPAQPERA